jgi:putative inorganic carbon (hco3(-)) transporter
MVSAASFVATHPLAGAGLGMNILALNEVRGPTWRMVHNAYLQHAIELGIPGLVLFLLLMRSCFRSAAEARRLSRERAGPQRLYCLSDGIQTSLAAFAVAAVFHPVGYHFYFYYIAALAVAANAIAGRLANGQRVALTVGASE